MSEVEDAVNAFMNYMDSAKEWDQFPPGNICEIAGRIERRPFHFKYHSFEVWAGGKCVGKGASDNLLKSQISDQSICVSIHEESLVELVEPRFTFDEISENGDRIMWSRDILNERGIAPERKKPDIMSLFYKGGHIAKIALRFYNPDYMIELHGTSNVQQSASGRSRKSKSGSKYDGVLAYFAKHRFGTEMPVLTLLSILPPHDRCSILEEVLAGDSANTVIYEKLSMAYLKDNQEAKARDLLRSGLKSGALDAFTYEQLDEKISYLIANVRMTPSRSYSESLAILEGQFAAEAEGPFHEFYVLIASICASD
jgi:hypothetical protein